MKMFHSPSPAARTSGFLIAGLAAILPIMVAATDEYAGHGLSSSGAASTLGDLTTSLPSILGLILQALLGVVGVVFLIVIIYGGVLWMTAGGNNQTVAKARSLIISAVAGLAIIMAAYTITTFIIGIVSPSSAPSAPAGVEYPTGTEPPLAPSTPETEQFDQEQQVTGSSDQELIQDILDQQQQDWEQAHPTAPQATDPERPSVSR